MARKENPIRGDGSTPGARMRAARQHRGLSLNELAARLGYTKAYLSAVENGTSRPSAALLAGYTRVLGLPAGAATVPAAIVGGTVDSTSLDDAVTHIATEYGMSPAELALIREIVLEDARAKAATLRSALDWWSRPGAIEVCAIPIAGWQWREWPVERIVAGINRSAAEAMHAGIRELVIVLPPEKIGEMERTLQRPPFAERLQRISCVAQTVALGLGHALLQAAPAIGARPFALLLPDDQFDGRASESGVLRHLVESFGDGTNHVVAVAKLKDPRRLYGVARLGSRSQGGHQRIVRLAEKPDAAHPVFQSARATDQTGVYAVVGRYVLSPEIVTALSILAREPHSGGRVELLDALQWLLDHEHTTVAAYVMPSLVQLERDQTVFVASTPAVPGALIHTG